MIGPVIFLLFLVLTPHSSNGVAANALTDKICRQTDDFDFCSRSYAEYPVSDIKDLNRNAIAKLFGYVSDTNGLLKTLQEASKGEDLQNYEFCQFWYGLCLKELSGAKSSFESGDYEAMLSHEKECSRFVGNCGSELGDKGDLNLRALQKCNKVVVQMATICGRLLIGD